MTFLQKLRIIELAQQVPRVKYREIAAMTGLPLSVVTSVIIRAIGDGNVVARGRGRQPGDLNLNAAPNRNAAIIAALRKGDATFQDVGNAFGISREWVRRIAEPFGITGATLGSIQIAGKRRCDPAIAEVKAKRALEVAEKKKRRAAFEAAVIAMRERGATQSEIAAGFDRPQNTISRILVENGRRTREFRPRPGAKHPLANPLPASPPMRAAEAGGSGA